MGGVLPLAKGINEIAGAVNTVGRAVGTIQTLSGGGRKKETQDLALQQLQERQALQQQHAALWGVAARMRSRDCQLRGHVRRTRIPGAVSRLRGSGFRG